MIHVSKEVTEQLTGLMTILAAGVKLIATAIALWQ